MLQNFVRIRRGRPEDAAVLVDIIQYASEGLVTHVWSKMAEKGETAREVGLRRAAREEGAFSYRNALVLEAVGHPVAALIGYALPEEPEAIDYDSLPAIFVPPQELENMVPGTWYVNVLAVYPEFRGQGLIAETLTFAALMFWTVSYTMSRESQRLEKRLGVGSR
jgi:GNAT superfamily N-acetyltransferase